MGISRTLVTKALHHSNGVRVGAQTRDEIWRMAEQMGYRPRGVTTHNIGYVVPVGALRIEAETALLMQAEHALRTQGYRLTLANIDLDDLQPLHNVLNPKTVDGVIFMRWCNGGVREIMPPEVPFVVSSDEDGIGADIDLVTMDTVQSLENLTHYLLRLGHQRFCMTLGANAIGYHARLKRGVLHALAAAGLPEKNLQIIELQPSRSTARETNEDIAGRLLAVMRQPQPPTAVIATSPNQAIPALYALRGAGYEVPGDVSVVSALDSPHFRAYAPWLTATTMEGPEVAWRAVERLIEKIHQPQSSSRHVLVAGEVIPRESAGPVRLRSLE